MVRWQTNSAGERSSGFLSSYPAPTSLRSSYFFPETQRKIVGDGSIPATGIYRSLFSHFIAGRTKNNGKDRDGNDGEVTKRPHHVANPLACIPVLLDKGSLSVIMIGLIYYSISRALGASLAVQSIEIYNLNYLGAGLVYIPSGVAGIFSSYLTGRPLYHSADHPINDMY